MAIKKDNALKNSEKYVVESIQSLGGESFSDKKKIRKSLVSKYMFDLGYDIHSEQECVDMIIQLLWSLDEFSSGDRIFPVDLSLVGRDYSDANQDRFFVLSDFRNALTGLENDSRLFIGQDIPSDLRKMAWACCPTLEYEALLCCFQSKEYSKNGYLFFTTTALHWRNKQESSKNWLRIKDFPERFEHIRDYFTNEEDDFRMNISLEMRKNDVFVFLNNLCNEIRRRLALD